MTSSTLAADEIPILKQHQRPSSKSNNRYIKITECPTEPCAIFYTDAISQSIVVVCENPKHTYNTDTDIQKQVGASR